MFLLDNETFKCFRYFNFKTNFGAAGVGIMRCPFGVLYRGPVLGRLGCWACRGIWLSVLVAQVLMGGGLSLWVSSSKGLFTSLALLTVFLFWGDTLAGLHLIILEFVFSLVVLRLFLELKCCLCLGCRVRTV